MLQHSLFGVRAMREVGPPGCWRGATQQTSLRQEDTEHTHPISGVLPTSRAQQRQEAYAVRGSGRKFGGFHYHNAAAGDLVLCEQASTRTIGGWG